MHLQPPGCTSEGLANPASFCTTGDCFNDITDAFLLLLLLPIQEACPGDSWLSFLPASHQRKVRNVTVTQGKMDGLTRWGCLNFKSHKANSPRMENDLDSSFFPWENLSNNGGRVWLWTFGEKIGYETERLQKVVACQRPPGCFILWIGLIYQLAHVKAEHSAKLFKVHFFLVKYKPINFSVKLISLPEVFQISTVV